MITLRYGLLADFAASGGLGKLTIVHVFDHLIAIPERFGLPLGGGVLVLRLEGSVADAGPNNLRIELRDADERTLPDSTLRLENQFLTPAGPGLPFSAQLIYSLAPLLTPTPGDYHFTVLVSDKPLGTIPLYVVPKPSATFP